MSVNENNKIKRSHLNLASASRWGPSMWLTSELARLDWSNYQLCFQRFASEDPLHGPFGLPPLSDCISALISLEQFHSFPLLLHLGQAG